MSRLGKSNVCHLRTFPALRSYCVIYNKTFTFIAVHVENGVLVRTRNWADTPWRRMLSNNLGYFQQRNWSWSSGTSGRGSHSTPSHPRLWDAYPSRPVLCGGKKLQLGLALERQGIRCLTIALGSMRHFHISLQRFHCQNQTQFAACFADWAIAEYILWLCSPPNFCCKHSGCYDCGHKASRQFAYMA